MQPWVQMECVQLGPGSRIGRLDNVDLGTQQLVRERQEVAVQKLGATPSNFCTVSWCTMDSNFRFSELCAEGSEAVFFLPGNTEFDVYVPSGAQTTYVSFNQEEFLSGMRELDPEGWDHAPDRLTVLPAAHQAALENVVAPWFGEEGGTARLSVEDARRMVLRDVLEALGDSIRKEAAPLDRLRAYHVCRSARGYVEDRLAEDRLPTIVEICREFGVSQRTLQYAFHAYVEMSPQAYLRMCRLNRVRAALSQPASAETTVTEVASTYGFFHMGKFARYYRLQFHEPPSKTLARGLKRVS